MRPARPGALALLPAVLALVLVVSTGTPGLSARQPAADRRLSLPSGATVRVAPDWTVAEHKDGVTLQDPDRQVAIELVEVTGAPDLPAAIATAWALRRPNFHREIQSAMDAPGRQGWEATHRIAYRTSPDESRAVSATAVRKGPLTVAMLFNGSLAGASRRGSQIALVNQSLLPAGYVREMWTDRTPKPLDEQRLATLRAFIERMRVASDTPGVSVVLFDRERTLLEEGYGVRERGKPEPVTPDTLYMIASNTKALTTLLLATLVDEGRFGWDTPVVNVFPLFRIGDAETTKRVLVKHLLCACTGLPRQDFEWLFTWHTSSPEGQLAVLATMMPTTGFGELYQYSNPLASAAGYIGARIVRPTGELGAAYDAVMREKVFQPLGMTRTTFSFEEAQKREFAAPHSWDTSLTNVPVDMTLNHSILPVRPAGGAWSTVRDYANYVRLELAKGRLPDGSPFVSEKTLLARRAPQVRTSETSWYGMGLTILNVKGVTVLTHGGSMFGYKSNFFLLPDAGIGGVVMTNSDYGLALASGVMNRTLELLFDGTPEAEENFAAGLKQNDAFLKAQQKDWQIPPDPATVKRLAVKYHHAALGDLVVSRDGAALIFQIGAWKTPMATMVNPDGTTSFVTIAPGLRGLEFTAAKGAGRIDTLTLRDAQKAYEYRAVAGTE